MRVSLIIPYYNQSKTLEALLKSIEILKTLPFEVIVVDDSSTDNPFEIISRFPKVLAYKTPTNMGPSFTRNLGAKKAKGEVLLFIDSDCIMLRSDCIEKHLQVHKEHQNIILSGAIQGMGKNIIGRAVNYFSWSNNIPDLQKNNPVLTTHIPSAHFSIVKRDYIRIGGFDEELIAGEDTDFCRKAIQAGLMLMNRSDIIVGHYDLCDFIIFWKKKNGYGKQRILMKRKGVFGEKSFLVPENIFLVTVFSPFLALGLTFGMILRWLPHSRKVLLYFPCLFLFSLALTLGPTVYLYDAYIKRLKSDNRSINGNRVK